MSKLSFEIFCIESYADKVSIESYKVYELFKEEGLLELLRADYEDLHGMGMEYMVNFCQEYLGEKKVRAVKRITMTHGTIRATILPNIIEMICNKLHWNEEDALDRFYTSATGQSFSDDETGLYGQSALYIFGLFCEEMDISVFD